MLNKIIRYLSHLNGVEVGKVNPSGSHYFQAPGVKIRVSDHIATSFNPGTTLNIMVDTLTNSFCVFYGNRIVPIQNYDKLREFLRNFVMVCDVLAPLSDIRNAKVIERVVTVEKPIVVSTAPTENDDDYIFVGDLDASHKAGCRRNVENVRHMITLRPKPIHKKKKKK